MVVLVVTAEPAGQQQRVLQVMVALVVQVASAVTAVLDSTVLEQMVVVQELVALVALAVTVVRQVRRAPVAMVVQVVTPVVAVMAVPVE